MKKPTLVVMAAGMGSRFGGLKQMTPIDPQGNSIIQYSLYDARLAGFDKVVFIIKHEIEHDFREKVGRGVEPYFDVSYVFQELTSCLPQGFTVPEGRTKPWGTGHAVLCARGVIDGPFAVINSDDFYGRGAFTAIGGFLTGQHADNAYAMVGYRLHNAMTEHGSVARGVCELRDGYLTGITERTHNRKARRRRGLYGGRRAFHPAVRRYDRLHELLGLHAAYSRRAGGRVPTLPAGVRVR